MLRQTNWTICAVVFVMAILPVSVFGGCSQVGTTKNQPEVDTNRFPITDYTALEPSDPAARSKRVARSKRYNNKFAPKISESSDGMYLVNNSLPSLPALPVDKSSAVIICEITGAEAYLSEDKTSIYSQFDVGIEASIKNDTTQDLRSGNAIEVERYGGRVRLPSGKIVVSSVDHQDMPRVGARYLLFLTGGGDQDFSILMGYELRAGKVFPLDQTGPKHPVTAYLGQDEATLINDISSALAKSSLRIPLN